MAFPEKEATKLMVKCHRRCCVCHRFCGVKMEMDHIDPQYAGGSDDIDNAIPVCFECHAEIHSYNDKHPRGRKFKPDELKAHRNQWIKLCRQNPSMLTSAPRDKGVGPLQALLDELEYNSALLLQHNSTLKLGPAFVAEQFHRAIAEGSIALLNDDLKTALLETYATLRSANQWVDRAIHGSTKDFDESKIVLQKMAPDTKQKIETAKASLLRFLGREK